MLYILGIRVLSQLLSLLFYNKRQFLYLVLRDFRDFIRLQLPLVISQSEGLLYQCKINVTNGLLVATIAMFCLFFRA